VRALVAGLESPHPLGEALPAIYQDDDFTQRWLRGFDEVLAPIFCTLDNLPSYIDPWLAPGDFVSWLAGWVGVALEEEWPDERRRSFVAQAAELFARRGTLSGLAAEVAMYAGTDPEIVESGGAAWSPQPGGIPPGDDSFTITVRVRGVTSLSAERLDAIVARAKPAHVVHAIELGG